MKALLVAAAGVLAACGGAAATGPDPSLFAYDQAQPLAVQVGERSVYAGLVREQLTFAAGYGERLNAVYTHPEHGAPWPVVLFSPGSGGDETEQLPDANVLVRRGIASLTLATPQPLVTCDAQADVRTYSDYVISRRRALDLIPSLEGADPTRVAAVGFSFGAAITGTLAGVDHRLTAAVIQSGRAHLSTAIRNSCTRLGAKKLAAYVDAFSVVDPVNYVSNAHPAAFLFQNGTLDALSPKPEVEAYVAAASGPKQLRWYKAGHRLTAAAFRYRDVWLARRLGVASAVLG